MTKKMRLLILLTSIVCVTLDAQVIFEGKIIYDGGYDSLPPEIVGKLEPVNQQIQFKKGRKNRLETVSTGETFTMSMIIVEDYDRAERLILNHMHFKTKGVKDMKTASIQKIIFKADTGIAAGAVVKYYDEEKMFAGYKGQRAALVLRDGTESFTFYACKDFVISSSDYPGLEQIPLILEYKMRLPTFTAKYQAVSISEEPLNDELFDVTNIPKGYVPQKL